MNLKIVNNKKPKKTKKYNKKATPFLLYFIEYCFVQESRTKAPPDNTDSKYIEPFLIIINKHDYA